MFRNNKQRKYSRPVTILVNSDSFIYLSSGIQSDRWTTRQVPICRLIPPLMSRTVVRLELVVSHPVEVSPVSPGTQPPSSYQLPPGVYTIRKPESGARGQHCVQVPGHELRLSHWLALSLLHMPALTFFSYVEILVSCSKGT